MGPFIAWSLLYLTIGFVWAHGWIFDVFVERDLKVQYQYEIAKAFGQEDQFKLRFCLGIAILWPLFFGLFLVKED